MDAFPAYFPLHGRRVVIAGEGEAAEAKARLFASSPALVERVQDEAALDPGAYAGAVLAFVAGGDTAFLEGAARAARQAGVPVNVVDHPRLCDFTTPSVVDRGEVVAAVGTGGASPMLASLLRHDIETRVPEGAGRVAALFRQTQAAVRAALPDLDRRRAFLRQALSGAAARAALDDDMAAAHRLLAQELDAFRAGAAPAGRVRFLAAAGPADLISLRAAAALAQAEVLVIDPGVTPAIVDIARRDAQRLEAAEVSARALADLAGGGKQVVRLVAGAVSSVEVAALDLAGVAHETLPVAG